VRIARTFRREAAEAIPSVATRMSGFHWWLTQAGPHASELLGMRQPNRRARTARAAKGPSRTLWGRLAWAALSILIALTVVWLVCVPGRSAGLLARGLAEFSALAGLALLSLVAVPVAWANLASRFPRIEAGKRWLVLGVGAAIVGFYAAPTLVLILLAEGDAESRLRVLVWSALLSISIATPRLLLPALGPGRIACDRAREGARRSFYTFLTLVGLSTSYVLALLVLGTLRVRVVAHPSEAKLHLAMIRAAERGYFADYGTYVPFDWTPPGRPGRWAREWPACPDAPGASDPGYCELGLFPERPTFCSYSVVVDADRKAYTAVALCDMDSDGVPAVWGLVVPAPGEQVGIAGVSGYCSPLGVLESSSSVEDRRALDRVGACVRGSGLSIF